jgi:Rieske Fe-S protein
MNHHKIRFSLATVVFLAGATAAFAQTTAVPAANSMNATAKPPMTAAQIAFKHHKLPKSFSTEVAAKDHCKTPVIWAETTTRVYYPQASGGFGTARPGVYACVKDAIKAGYRKGAA